MAALALMLPLAARAQMIGRLAGRVTDDNDLPLQGAAVKVVGAAPAREVIINKADGSYAIPGMRPGDYEIEFTAKGYEPQRKTVRIAADRTSILNARLNLDQPESVVGVPRSLEPAPKPSAADTKVANIDRGSGAEPPVRPVSPPPAIENAPIAEPVRVEPLPRDSASLTSGGILVNVIDEEGKPLAGARLVVGDAKRSLAALPDGSIGVEKLLPGDYEVTLTAKGCQPEKRTVRVSANRTITLIVKLATYRGRSE